MPSTVRRSGPFPWLVLAAMLLQAIGPPGPARGVEAAETHLVVSEVVTGGASASDELIELHNPTASSLPLEGLELIYVSATGATISRRAAWAAGTPEIPAGGHLLVANEAGIYAPIADALYASGMAATGGSVAIRIQGALSAIDAVGWGTAASTWLEGVAVAPPAAGASVERLPGGSQGSSQDTDDNLSDFVHRLVPDPQNLGSPPTPPAPASAMPVPSASPNPGPSGSADPTPGPTPEPVPSGPPPTPTPTPAPTVVSVVDARAAADGTIVTVEATALTGSGFHDGGGFVVDETGGIAVLLADGAYARGDRLRVTGEVDDRFSQRTLRTDAAGITLLGAGVEPSPLDMPTGAVSEAVEGRLARIAGIVAGSPTVLTSGLGFDVDDGSGAVRVIVATVSGIDTDPWTAGVAVDLVGVVGQRDSSGSGTAGYRVQPRDWSDVLSVGAGTGSPSADPSPSPAPSSSPGAATPTPAATPAEEGVISIAEARRVARNARVRVAGVVTLPMGLIDPRTAVIQDATGAIVLRLGEEAGRLALGDRVRVEGIRSSKAGMETLRVSDPAARLGAGTGPEARTVRTGAAGEAEEALVVTVRGALVANARRASSGSVSFEVDDGSGALRVVLGASLEADRDSLLAGTWVEVTGVLGQETTGALPLRGYRVWPRSAAEVRVVAAATDADEHGGPGSDDSPHTQGGLPSAILERIGAPDLAGLRIGATLVAGPWPELEVGGVLWDGVRLVLIDRASSAVVDAVLTRGPVPLALDLSGLSAHGQHRATGAPLVRLGRDPGQVLAATAPAAAPRGTLAGPLPAWVSVSGRLTGDSAGGSLVVDGRRVRLEERCDDRPSVRHGTVSVTGIAAGDPLRLIVACGGVRPLPAVLRTSRTDTPASTAAPTAAPAQPLATSSAALEARRPGAAGLLLLAAVVMAAAAALRRRAVRDGQLSDAIEAAGSAEAPSEVPRLTLVPMPREHGP